jgi:hypothetical protein
MRVLFDQGTPTALADFLAGHFIRTTRQEGWETLSNGDLLRAAEDAGFDVLLTTDNNLAYQQNFKNSENCNRGPQPQSVAHGAADESQDRGRGKRGGARQLRAD